MEAIRGHQGCRGVRKAGKKCRYSGQKGYRWHKGSLGGS